MALQPTEDAQKRRACEAVLSTKGSFNCIILQLLVPKSASLCVDEFVEDSLAFVEEIVNRDDAKHFMANFDVTSLFTNITFQI